MANNTYTLSEQQLKVISGLSALGKVTIKDVSFAHGGGKGQPAVEAKLDKVVFDFSELDAENLFRMLLTRAFVVQYRSRFWVRLAKEAVEANEQPDLSLLPNVVTIDELCSEGNRGAGMRNLKEKVSVANAAVLATTSALVGNLMTTIGLSFSDAFKQVPAGVVSETQIKRYMRESSLELMQEACKRLDEEMAKEAVRLQEREQEDKERRDKDVRPKPSKK